MTKIITVIISKRSKLINLFSNNAIYCFKCLLMFLITIDVISRDWSFKNTILSFEGMLQFDSLVRLCKTLKILN